MGTASIGFFAARTRGGWVARSSRAMTNWGNLWLLRAEEPEFHRLAHQEIADWRGMHVVAAIVGRDHLVWFVRVLNHRVEIDHRVEARALLDVVIDLMADRVLRGIPGSVTTRNDGRTDDAKVLRMRALDDDLDARHQPLRGSAAHDVVGASKAHDVRHAGMRKHITVEALDAGRRIDLGIIVCGIHYRVAADAFIDHRAIGLPLQG